MFPYIVADIGGTNVCFGLVRGRSQTTARYDIGSLWEARSTEFDNFESCLDAFLSTISGDPPANGCIAIAGPVTSDQVQMTNLDWGFSIKELRKQFSMKRLDVINDFAALAYSTLCIETDDLLVLNPGTPSANAPRAIIGPGTGLGVAELVPTQSGWQPLAGEGGHMAFAPQSSVGQQILECVSQNTEYVCVETLLSGSGLARLYQALAVVQGTPAKPLSPEQITTHALAGSDPASRESLDLFFQLLGETAGNISLIYGAKGGVFLGGGILPRVSKLLLESDFMTGFQSKGMMSDYLADVPVWLMTGTRPALLGAASWYYDKTFDHQD